MQACWVQEVCEWLRKARPARAARWGSRGEDGWLGDSCWLAEKWHLTRGSQA